MRWRHSGLPFFFWPSGRGEDWMCRASSTHTHTHTWVSLIPANLFSHQYVWSVQVSVIDFSSPVQCNSEWKTSGIQTCSISFIVPLFLLPSHQIFSSLLVFLSSHTDLSSGPLRFSINMLLTSSCEVLNIQRTFSILLYLSGLLACFYQFLLSQASVSLFLILIV